MDGASNSRNCLYTCYLIAVVKGLFLEGWVGGTRLCPHPILRFFYLTFAQNQTFTETLQISEILENIPNLDHRLKLYC